MHMQVGCLQHAYIRFNIQFTLLLFAIANISRFPGSIRMTLHCILCKRGGKVLHFFNKSRVLVLLIIRKMLVHFWLSASKRK